MVASTAEGSELGAAFAAIREFKEAFGGVPSRRALGSASPRPVVSAASPGCERCGRTDVEVNSSVDRSRICLSCLELIESDGSPPKEPKRNTPPHRQRLYGTGSTGSPSADEAAAGASRREAGPKDALERATDVRACASVLAIEHLLGRWGPCALPGHDDHLARVCPTSGGFWQYNCEGQAVGFGLAELRAFQGYGEVRHISNVEAARWRERLQYEAGLLLDRGPAPIPLPERCSEATRRVGEAWRLLVGLRDPMWGAEPFTYAREFVAAYAGVTEEQARRAVDELEEFGSIIRTGEKNGLALLRRPGPTLLLYTGSYDGVVQAFLDAFDGEEIK